MSLRASGTALASLWRRRQHCRRSNRRQRTSRSLGGPRGGERALDPRATAAGRGRGSGLDVVAWRTWGDVEAEPVRPERIDRPPVSGLGRERRGVAEPSSATRSARARTNRRARASGVRPAWFSPRARTACVCSARISAKRVSRSSQGGTRDGLKLWRAGLEWRAGRRFRQGFESQGVTTG